MPDVNNRHPRSSGFLSKIRKIFSLNIGTVLFGFLFLYMVFSAILYLTSPKIESYQVIAGPLSRNETYTGLALREEAVQKADSGGYVTYYAREGNKINAGGNVYGISSTQTAESSAVLSAEELASVRSEMLSFSKGFNPSNFNNTYSFKYELEGSILQYAGGDEGSSSVVSVGNQNVFRADSDGIVLYSMDGYEGKTVDTLTAADFDQNAYHETDLKTDGAVEAGTSAARFRSGTGAGRGGRITIFRTGARRPFRFIFRSATRYASKLFHFALIFFPGYGILSEKGIVRACAVPNM